jgi:hypothetical protein
VVDLLVAAEVLAAVTVAVEEVATVDVTEKTHVAAALETVVAGQTVVAVEQ